MLVYQRVPIPTLLKQPQTTRRDFVVQGGGERNFVGTSGFDPSIFPAKMVGDSKGNQNISGKLGGETSNIFFSPRKLGKKIQFDEHIFQMG